MTNTTPVQSLPTTPTIIRKPIIIPPYKGDGFSPVASGFISTHIPSVYTHTTNANPIMIIPPYKGDGFSPTGIARKGLSPIIKITIGLACFLLLHQLYKFLFKSTFPCPYTHEKYPLTKEMYDALDKKLDEKVRQLKLKPNELKVLAPARFKQLFHDELASVKKCYETACKRLCPKLSEQSTYNEKCPISGEAIYFPVRACYLGGKTGVYEAAYFYIWVRCTGRDFVTTKEISVNNIEIDEEIFPQIHPELSKQYQKRITKIVRFTQDIFWKVWAFIKNIFSTTSTKTQPIKKN